MRISTPSFTSPITLLLLVLHPLQAHTEHHDLASMPQLPEDSDIIEASMLHCLGDCSVCHYGADGCCYVAGCTRGCTCHPVATSGHKCVDCNFGLGDMNHCNKGVCVCGWVCSLGYCYDLENYLTGSVVRKGSERRLLWLSDDLLTMLTSLKKGDRSKC